jgi:hypothetical protein
MKTIPIEPFYDKLQEYHRDNHIDVSFWDWLKAEYGAYQVYIKSNPTAVGEKEASGLMFGEDEEATLFALRWS